MKLMNPCREWGTGPAALLLLLGLCAPACRPRTSIALTVKGLRGVPTARALLVTLRLGDGKEQQQEFPRPPLEVDEGGDEARLGFLFAEEPRGDVDVDVTVQALPPAEGDAFVLAKGTQRGQLREARLALDVVLKQQQVCSQSGWCWEVPQSSAQLLRAVWGSGPGDIWAAGNFGLLLHYDGRYWSLVDLPPEAGEPDLTALWGSGPSDVWAVGGVAKQPGYLRQSKNWGQLLHFDGRQWSVIYRNGNWEFLTGLSGAGPGEVWVSGGLDATPDSGVSVPDGIVARCTLQGCDAPTRLAPLLPQVMRDYGTIHDVWTAGVGKPVWAVGTWREKGKTGDQGVILRKPPAGEFAVVKSFAGRVTHLWGQGEELWAGYVPTTPPPQGNLVANQGSGRLFRRDPGTDDTSWTMIDPGDLPMPRLEIRGQRWGLRKGMQSNGAPDAIVNKRAEDANLSWFPIMGAGQVGPTATAQSTARLPQTAPRPPQVQALWGAAPSDVWAVGSQGLLDHYAQGPDSPGAWGRDGAMGAGRLPIIHGLWASGSTEAYAVGEGGVILRYDGAAWVAEAGAEGKRLLGVWGADGEVWAVGEAGTILRRRGGAWTKAAPVSQDLFSVWGTGPGDLWAVGADGAILGWSGSEWSYAMPAVSGGPTLLAVSGGAGGQRWAVGCQGYRQGAGQQQQRAYRRVGAAWEMVAVPAGRDDHCLDHVWFEDESAVWLGGRAELLNRYDQKLGTWSSVPGGGLRNCSGVRQGVIWCSDMAFKLYDGSSWRLVEAGLDDSGGYYTGDARGLFMVGDDLWSFGVGIAHCKGANCSDPRR